MRLISPHLSIYKFPLAAISSITNRVSGMYITGLGFSCMFFSLLSKDKQEKYLSYYHNSNIYIQKSINSVFLYPFGYHIMGGLRHFLWDSFPNLLSKSGVAKSSKLLFISSIIPTLMLENKLSKKFKN